MSSPLRHFREVWLCDFEFQAGEGERQRPICMVAREYFSGRTIRLWRDELEQRDRPPFPVGPNTLFVAYFASAEFGCFLPLGWGMPARVLDLYCEFRCLTNGLATPHGSGLLGALQMFGCDSMLAVEKQEMRDLAMRGGPFTSAERDALLDYCESDVVALAHLLPKMLPHIDLSLALLRGRYMEAVARMEFVGVPIDNDTLGRLRDNWGTIRSRLVETVDRDFGVYEGATFKISRFAEWLASKGIPWPRLESGELALDDQSFREMAKIYPTVGPLRELRFTLGKMKLESLSVGSDGRNRCLLSPFRSKTGRNQPSNSKFIFGPSCWLRGLIRPQPSRAIAYIDYSQQEFAIAAKLSNDAAMMDAYRSGDPYLTFAKQAGAVPQDATKQSHKTERDLFKTCALGVQYGMGERSLASRIGQPLIVGRKLLEAHRRTYPRFWRWSQAAMDHATLQGRLHSIFGWNVQVGDKPNPRSCANFPMQANGAEMLRLACCLATERGIKVCAPIHDAVLVEGPIETIQDTIAKTRKAMAEASRIVLDGFEVATDVEVVAHPNRYMDPRGAKMWSDIMAILKDLASRGSP